MQSGREGVAGMKMGLVKLQVKQNVVTCRCFRLAINNDHFIVSFANYKKITAQMFYLNISRKHHNMYTL